MGEKKNSPPSPGSPSAPVLGRCTRTFRSVRRYQRLLRDYNIEVTPRHLTWLVMWDQSCLLPSSSRFFFSRARISMMRSAMPLTSPSHCLYSCGSFRMVDAMRAPWTGGLE